MGFSERQVGIKTCEKKNNERMGSAAEIRSYFVGVKKERGCQRDRGNDQI